MACDPQPLYGCYFRAETVDERSNAPWKGSLPCGRKRSMVLGGPVPGMDRMRDPHEQQAPGLRRGLLLVQKGCGLPTDLEVGSATCGGGLATKDVTAGDKLDPERTVAFVVRGRGGFAQRVQAVLRRTR
jgi:hypothetical protein